MLTATRSGLTSSIRASTASGSIPWLFRRDSMLGAPGLIEAWRRGNVAIANAPGTGVADDKVIYPYVPAMIRYYLGEEPLMDNVPTFDLTDDQQRHTLSPTSTRW